MAQTPMDLGKVASRLESGAYSSAAGVAQDVRLVWRNCRTFNEPGSDVVRSCDELAGFFDQLWKQAKLERVRGPVPVFPCCTACNDRKCPQVIQAIWSTSGHGAPGLHLHQGCRLNGRQLPIEGSADHATAKGAWMVLCGEPNARSSCVRPGAPLTCSERRGRPGGLGRARQPQAWAGCSRDQRRAWEGQEGNGTR